MVAEHSSKPHPAGEMTGPSERAPLPACDGSSVSHATADPIPYRIVAISTAIGALTHENTEEIYQLAREQAAVLAAQDRGLAQQTEVLALLRGHMVGSEESREAGVTDERR